MQSISLFIRCTVLAGALAASPAFADHNFSAHLTNFGYTLTDLDPNDAYTPSAPDFSQGHSAGWLWLTARDPYRSIERKLKGNVFDALGDSDQLGPFSGSWSVGANLDQHVALTGSGYGMGWMEADFQMPVTLQPNTAITISGHLAMDWSQTGTWVPDDYSSVSMLFRLGGGDNGTSESVYRFEAPDSIDTDMSLTFINRGATPLDLQFFSSIYAHSSVSLPVPEPATYAMLGAGLAIVGLAARRRQRPSRA